MDWSQWPNFSEEEFRCKGDGSCEMDEHFLTVLQDLRTQCGFPLYINSGYRSPQYNESVGGAEDSQHIHGRAADIGISYEQAVRLLTLAFADERVTGIGIQQKGDPKKRFVHLDTRPGPRVVWTY